MTENAEKIEDAAAADAKLESKQGIRRIVWNNLEKNNLVNFPRPVYGRIPNFKGCEEAAEKVSQLDVFKHAQNIKVNPDKPQEPVRFAVLEHQKDLFVPIPRLSSGLLKHIVLPENAIKDDIRKAVSRRGIDSCGKEVGFSDEVKIDLVVLGSVAVSKDGYRIGKGKGYADLEFAILSQMKAVNPNTVVVTTVHDTQVFESFPPELFGPHDVPVDIILTPTQVYHIEKRLPKPEGIIWNLVSPRRVNLMPILQTLRDADEKAGKDVSLKEVDSDVENYPPSNRRPFRRVRTFRYGGSRRSRNSENTASGDAPSDEIPNGEQKPQPQRRRRFNRRRSNNQLREAENNETSGNEGVAEENGQPKRPPRRNFRKNRSLIDFSLIVRNIEKTVRVRDLKAALAERGIKPNIITWRGVKGYCCLHFSKTNPNTMSNVDQDGHGVDNVLGMLQNLKVSPDSKKQLRVEIMRPISKIETMDVTSV